MACDLDEVAFMFVDAVVLEMAPSSSSVIQSLAELTGLEATPVR